MKKASKLFLISVLILSISALYGCKSKDKSEGRPNFSINIDSLFQTSCNQYKLYPTTNMYNFIRLNTTNGIMDMVQWNTEDGKEFVYKLNRIPLCQYPKEGKYELYNTENFYTFILLDKYTGECWHVQWNFDEDKRFVQKIN